MYINIVYVTMGLYIYNIDVCSKKTLVTINNHEQCQVRINQHPGFNQPSPPKKNAIETQVVPQD